MAEGNIPISHGVDQFGPPDSTQFTMKKKPVNANGESFFLHRDLSGRFWIALALVIGLILSTIMILHGNVKLEVNTIMVVYTSFSGGAFSLVGIYMGQNMKKDAASGPTTPTTTPPATPAK